MNKLQGARALARHVKNTGLAAGRIGIFDYPPGHYYSPLGHPRERAALLDSIDWNPGSIPGVDLRESAQLELLERLLPMAVDLQLPDSSAPGRRFYLDNPSYRHSDATLYAALLRLLQPRRIIEVGSGFSSALTLDTVERYFLRPPDLLFIDPYPVVARKLLSGEEFQNLLVRSRVQEVSLERFEALESGDILFIDSTHVVRAGGDVNFLVFEVLPRLAPGVYVHFHDVAWPFEYPSQWLSRGRSWGESYILRAFLQYNSAFEIVLFNTFLEQRHESWFRTNLPICLVDRGGSLWIRRK